jgi:hypothetical protein
VAYTDSEIAQAHEAARSASAHSEDLYKLGLIYSIGDSTDLVEAHKWFNLAATRGSEAAKECRRELSEQMSKDEIAAAQRAAREWLTVTRH